MKKIVISLGGSLIAKDKIEVNYLKKFKEVILKNKKDKQFIIIVGGGRTARNYQEFAKDISEISDVNLDWIGIQGTRLNAQVVKAVFDKEAPNKIIHTPEDVLKLKNKVIIGGGWKPGWSTDYVAVYIAKLLKADVVINLTNADYIYTKDPNKYKNVKPFKEMTWHELKNIVGHKWIPGLNLPFDPMACQLAEKSNISVIVMNGYKLKNFDNYLQSKKFIGTTIK